MAQEINEYALALYELAAENGAVAEFSAALDTVSDVFRKDPGYADLLASPGIPRSERLTAIEQAFAGLPEYVVSLLSLLCEKDRIHEVQSCVAAFRQLCADADSISTAQVVSAVPLTEAQQAALIRKLEKLCAHRVVLDCRIDPALLGGMTVTIDGKLIDGSIRHQLHAIKEVMYT